MPASTMESPRTRSMNDGPVPVNCSGMGRSSSTFSSARTPVPAATSPTSGTLRTAAALIGAVVAGSQCTWIARGLLGSRER